jgi:hypothetical protein
MKGSKREHKICLSRKSFKSFLKVSLGAWNMVPSLVNEQLSLVTEQRLRCHIQKLVNALCIAQPLFGNYGFFCRSKTSASTTLQFNKL